VEASAASAQTAPQLASTRARIAALDSQLGGAKRELTRVHSLVTTGSLPSVEEERARDRVTELEAQLAAARADLNARQIELEASANRARAAVDSLATRVADTEVRAPQDGVVLARYVEPGEVVAVNQSLLKVGDTKSLLLEVNIDETDVARVHDGHDGQPASRVAASLHGFPNRSFAGRVTMVLPDANRETKSYLAKVQLDDPPAGLRSGMTAEVNILVVEHENVLLAPADAIKDGKVWCIVDGHAERKPVTVGIHDLLRAEIVSGLSEGDLVAIGGVDRLERDKMRVKVTMQQPDAFTRGGH
jgi:RND family efflux transporter MFP subunit